MPVWSGGCLGKAACWCWLFFLLPSRCVLSFIPFVLNPEKLLLMACTPGFLGFYLGPTTERQHQGIRARRRENVDWIFTSPCMLAAFGHGAASCPQLLWKSAARQVLPKLPFFAFKSGSDNCFPCLVLISFNLFSPLSGISPGHILQLPF